MKKIIPILFFIVQFPGFKSLAMSKSIVPVGKNDRQLGIKSDFFLIKCKQRLQNAAKTNRRFVYSIKELNKINSCTDAIRSVEEFTLFTSSLNKASSGKEVHFYEKNDLSLWLSGILSTFLKKCNELLNEHTKKDEKDKIRKNKSIQDKLKTLFEKFSLTISKIYDYLTGKKHTTNKNTLHKIKKNKEINKDDCPKKIMEKLSTMVKTLNGKNKSPYIELLEKQIEHFKVLAKKYQA